MSTELVTAHAGKNHVDASDIGALYAGALGGGRYSLDVGEGLAVSMTDANTLHIGTGGFIFDGRWVRVTDGGEDVKIANGSQGAYRKDLVTYTYTRDPSSGNIEEGKWGVAQGTAASKESDAKVPEIEEGDILDGALTATCAVAEVDLAGLTPTAKLLLPSVASLKTFGDSVSRLLEPTDSGWVDMYGAYGTGSYVSYRLTGNLVELTWNFVQESRDIWTAGTLPVGFRPRGDFHSCTFMADAAGVNNDHVSEVEVTRNGSVRFIAGAAISRARSIGNVTFIADV